MQNHTKTNLPLTQTTQIAHTHTSKPELGSVVSEEFCTPLDASHRLNKHRTGAPPSTPPSSSVTSGSLVIPVCTNLQFANSGSHVVNGVRHTSLRDALTRRDD